MATQGPNSAGTGASNSGNGGTRVWSNTANIVSSNNAYATANGRNQTTEWLVASNFGFSIPSTATIEGVTVEAELSSETTTDENTVVDVTLWDAGAIGTEKNPGTTITTTDAYYSWGGASDVWGVSLTPAIVNGSDFGVAFAIEESTTTEDKRVDHVRITITYTLTSTVDAAFISSGSTLYAATLTPGDATLAAAFLSSGATLYAASVYDPARVAYRGKARRARRPSFSLAVYGRLPEKSAPHELYVPPSTQLNWSSGIPGGWLSAQIGMPDMADMLATGQRRPASHVLPRGLDMPPKGHVEIWESGTGLVFEGQLEGGERVGRYLRGLDIDGYGVALTQIRQFEGGNSTDLVAAGKILRSIVGELVPHITIGEIADSGVLHTYSEFARMTPLQALDMLAKEGAGGDTGTRYIWHVYHRTLSFVAATLPTTPTYQIPYDERVTVREDYRGVVSRMRMYYRDAVTGADTLSGWFTNLATENDYGRIDRLVEGGQVSDAGASQFIRTQLAATAEPTYSITIQRAPGEGMEGVGGDTPAYRVLPGETVEIDGLGTFLIANTRNGQVDGGGIQTQIEIGEPVTRSEAAVFDRLLELDATLRSGRDPQNLGRWSR